MSGACARSLCQRLLNHFCRVHESPSVEETSSGYKSFLPRFLQSFGRPLGSEDPLWRMFSPTADGESTPPKVGQVILSRVVMYHVPKVIPVIPRG